MDKRKSNRRVKSGSGIGRNTVLFFIAVVLFAYTGIISVFPYFYNKSFNIAEFETNMKKATSFWTSVDNFSFKITPSLHSIITLSGVNFEWIDKQPLFKAQKVVIETKNPFAVITKKFNIESIKVVSATYTDLIMADGRNKLESLPKGYDSSVFGVPYTVILPGVIKVKDFTINRIMPTTGYIRHTDSKTYAKTDVKEFLNRYEFATVKIR